MSKVIEIMDKAETIDEVVGLAVGAGSTCWESLKETGVFQSEQANEIVTAAVDRIKYLIAHEACSCREQS